MSDAPQRTVHVGPIAIGNHRPFVLIAGPCQIESRAHALEVASALRDIAAGAGVPLIYKSSFDKANRTSIAAARGIGMTQGLGILADVRAETGLPTLTDVHAPDQCVVAVEAVDVLQIPAFLCRQTDLLLAAGAAGKPVNIKKGQFLAPWDMAQVAAKIASTGNQNILLCERGSSFGYNTLVTDFRALPIMARSRLSGGVRRHPFGPTAGRAGRLIRRATRIRPRARPRGRGGGCCSGVHRNASGSRPRTVGRAKHDSAEGDADADRPAEGI